MKKIECIVIDDEPNAIKLLQSHIEKIPVLNLKYSCYDAIEGLDFITKNKVDLVFLDINMPLLSGLELAETLPGHQKIIFTTAYSNYAIQSYEYEALDYIQKPITFVRFLKAVTKAETYFNTLAQTTGKKELLENKEYIFIKSEKKLVKIDLRSIVYFEAQKEYISIHTTGKKHIFFKRMKELQHELPHNFVRVHHSFIVNLDYITRIESSTVILEQSEIPIGDTFKEYFLTIIRGQTL
jgi:two-component system LytT family response regulator